jgi:hypothetical protein
LGLRRAGPSDATGGAFVDGVPAALVEVLVDGRGAYCRRRPFKRTELLAALHRFPLNAVENRVPG